MHAPTQRVTAVTAVTADTSITAASDPARRRRPEVRKVSRFQNRFGFESESSNQGGRRLGDTPTSAPVRRCAAPCAKFRDSVWRRCGLSRGPVGRYTATHRRCSFARGRLSKPACRCSRTRLGPAAEAGTGPLAQACSADGQHGLLNCGTLHALSSWLRSLHLYTRPGQSEAGTECDEISTGSSGR